MRARSTLRDLSVIFAAGLLLRLALLFLYPIPYGHDAIGRVFFKDSFFFAHWLPLAQSIVYLAARLWESLTPIRITFAVLGALSACGFYLFLKDLVSRNVAVLGGILFSFNSLFVVLSLMPYQDVLFLGLFYAALALLFKESPLLKSALGSFFYGLACLTRYEAWFVLPFLVWWRVKLDVRNLQASGFLSFLRASLVFGWAPLAWIALSWFQFGEWSGVFKQTGDQSFYGWNPHFDLQWIAAYAKRTGYWLLRFGSPIVLLALIGVISIIRNWNVVWLKLKLLLVFGGFVVVFFFFIIGKEFETVNRFSMIPLSIVLVLTVIGLDQVKNWLLNTLKWSWVERPAFTYTFFGVVAAFLITYAGVTMKRLTERTEFRGPYEISNYLESALTDQEKAVVVAERFRDLSDAAPMAYQRIIAQSRLGRDRILSAGLIGLDTSSELLDFAEQNHLRYVVVFEDFEPWLPADTFFSTLATSGAETFKIVFKTEGATVYEVVSWTL